MANLSVLTKALSDIKKRNAQVHSDMPNKCIVVLPVAIGSSR